MINEKYEGTDKLIELGDTVMYNGEMDKIIGVETYDRSYNDYILESGGYVEYYTLEYLAIKPHKHRDLIIAWANGAEIECLMGDTWYDREAEPPVWIPTRTYRIKPTAPPKSPKQLEKERIQKEMEKLTKDLEALDV